VSTLDRLLESVPDPQRETVRAALSSAFGDTSPTDAQRVTGGASGALTYRLEVAGRPYFMRVETRRDATRNPHQYTCLRTAAEAGIAPPLRHFDEAAGVVIMDFVASKPLAEYPGGPPRLAESLGKLARRLQGTSTFPELRDYPVILRGMMSFLRSSGRFAPGLLDAHAGELERIVTAYPWRLLPRVSSHNDPNPRNIIFDGERLWLVDWETAFRNDPMVDVAILVDNLASSPELEGILLGAWLGRDPDQSVRARLTVMRPLTRLYYGLILFALAPAPPEPHGDLRALTPREFGAALAQGTFAPGSPGAMLALAKMLLAGFLDAARAPDFDTALTVAAEG
jgi:hypothetical protein